MLRFSSDPKPRANSELTAEPSQPDEHSRPKISLVKRQSSETAPLMSGKSNINTDVREERKRSESEPETYTASKDYFIRRSNSLTEQAKHLSEEEIHCLEIDIFKPLDFYEILFNRMKESNSGKIVNSLSELDGL